MDAILEGALRQGESIDIGDHGRIILSSVEYDDFTERQFIHWQRCRGELDRESAYGDDGANNGISGDEITGFGRGATKITAQSGSAVMFVEIYYEYQALFENPFGAGDKQFREEAAFLIRDDRNLGPGLTGDDGDSEC